MEPSEGPSDRKNGNWFNIKSLTRRKKSSNKENNENVNIDTSVSSIPSTQSSFNRQSTTNNNQTQTSTKSTNVLSWVTMFRKRALQRRRDVNADLSTAGTDRLMNFERRAVANDYVVDTGLPNLDIPPDQMYIYSHILTPQQQHNFVMSRVQAMTMSNQIESPWLIQETSPNMEHLIMLNAQVLMNK